MVWDYFSEIIITWAIPLLSYWIISTTHTHTHLSLSLSLSLSLFTIEKGMSWWNQPHYCKFFIPTYSYAIATICEYSSQSLPMWKCRVVSILAIPSWAPPNLRCILTSQHLVSMLNQWCASLANYSVWCCLSGSYEWIKIQCTKSISGRTHRGLCIGRVITPIMK